jgi:type I restriction enzyme S subunit
LTEKAVVTGNIKRNGPNPRYQRQHWEYNYGKVPEGWDFVTIGSLFKERTEKSNDQEKFPLYSLTIEKGVTPKTERYERSFLLKDEEGNAFSVVRPGDFVFNPMNLRFGAVAYSKETYPVLVSAYYSVITPDLEKIDSVFMEALLRSKEIMDLYERIAIGSLVEKRRIHLSILNETYIPLPPIMEQRMVGSSLSKWDRTIELTESLIAAKEKRFLWFIKSLISDRCHSWEHLRTDKIFKSVSDKVHNGEELLSVTQDRGVIPRSMLEGRVMSPESGTDSYKLIKAGDFAISLRSFQGGIEYSKHQGLISPAYTVLRPRVKLHDELFRHFFKSHLFIKRYLSIAVIGIRDGKQISVPDFMTVKIPVPPLGEQKQIAAVLNMAQKEIDLLRKQGDALREQKKGLMQQLLTGKVRVKISPAEATAGA